MSSIFGSCAISQETAEIISSAVKKRIDLGQIASKNKIDFLKIMYGGGGAKSELKLELEKSMLNLAIGKAYVEEVKTILEPSTGKVTRVEKTRKQLPPNAR